MGERIANCSSHVFQIPTWTWSWTLQIFESVSHSLTFTFFISSSPQRDRMTDDNPTAGEGRFIANH